MRLCGCVIASVLLCVFACVLTGIFLYSFSLCLYTVALSQRNYCSLHVYKCVCVCLQGAGLMKNLISIYLRKESLSFNFIFVSVNV